MNEYKEKVQEMISRLEELKDFFNDFDPNTKELKLKAKSIFPVTRKELFIMEVKFSKEIETLEEKLEEEFEFPEFLYD